ncbi:hypothetical protein XENOCAPTIV_027056 [Xenoophorus captivus]|uniref:Uncharacterized protein n=1 Tax=Xenoophorus captivus TaxID=1517983 RepID=A0ABV0S8R8_9TELE
MLLWLKPKCWRKLRQHKRSPKAENLHKKKSKLESTSEYVQFQTGIIQSSCPEEEPTTSRPGVSSPDTFVTWDPLDEHSVESQPISSELKLTKDNVAALNMPSQPRDETKPRLEKPNTRRCSLFHIQSSHLPNTWQDEI